MGVGAWARLYGQTERFMMHHRTLLSASPGVGHGGQNVTEDVCQSPHSCHSQTSRPRENRGVAPNDWALKRRLLYPLTPPMLMATRHFLVPAFGRSIIES